MTRGEFYARKTALEDQLATVESEAGSLANNCPDPQSVTEALEELRAMSGAEHATYWRDPANVRVVKAALRRAGVRISIKDKVIQVSLDYA